MQIHVYANDFCTNGYIFIIIVKNVIVFKCVKNLKIKLRLIKYLNFINAINLIINK